MATRRYQTNANEHLKDVVEEVGAATDAKTIELTVDLAATAVNTGATTRQITKKEVLEGLKRIADHIEQTSIWPPA
jgi:hypothetical protein